MRAALWIWALVVAAIFCFEQQPRSQMLLLGAGKQAGGGAVAYVGPGNIVAGATAWWGLRAYSLADRGNKLINVCIVADVVCADLSSDATTGALVITTIGGSSCSVIVCTIKTFYDRSGANACGGPCDLTQATGSGSLRYNLIVNCIGTLPCANASSGNEVELNSTGFGSIPQQFTISQVFQRTSAGGAYQHYFADSASSNGVFGDMGANNVLMYSGGNLPTATANDLANHAGQFVFNNASGFAYIDGVNTTMNLGNNNSWASGSIGLGATGSRAAVQSNISEIGFWASGFSGAQAAAMNSNQHAYWGF